MVEIACCANLRLIVRLRLGLVQHYAIGWMIKVDCLSWICCCSLASCWQVFLVCNLAHKVYRRLLLLRSSYRWPVLVIDSLIVFSCCLFRFRLMLIEDVWLDKMTHNETINVLSENESSGERINRIEQVRSKTN